MVKIITDTTSGLPAEVARRYDIPVLPQVIIFGQDAENPPEEIAWWC